MKPKKIPLRMCIGCAQMKPKAELIRVVKEPDGTVSLDPTGKKNGRGAYVCKSTACFEKAVKAKKFERAFSVMFPFEVTQTLKEELERLEAR